MIIIKWLKLSDAQIGCMSFLHLIIDISFGPLCRPAAKPQAMLADSKSKGTDIGAGAGFQQSPTTFNCAYLPVYP